MPTKRKILIGGTVLVAVLIFVASGFWWGFQIGKNRPEHITVSGIQNIEDPINTGADFGIFWKTWQTINDEYLKAPDVSAKDRVYGAIKGLVGSLGDPYSQYFPPTESKEFQENVDGSFGGIGIEIGMRKDQLVVIAPLKGTPADQAGIRAGDKIFAINTTSTDGITLDEAVNLIRGPKGTKVTLTVFRDDWDKTRDFEITRGTISVPTLDFTMKDGNIAYIQLYSFNANAPQLFQDAATKAINQGAKGMILDMRNNPGGYLEVAVHIAGWFVPKGEIVVSETGRQGTIDEFRADGNAALANLPLVILVNKGSASASEILAGALRDIRTVPLVGEQTFGKGTVQELVSLPDNSSLKLTIAHWVLPSGHILENGGLEPDVNVELSDEDIEKKRDPQLDKAIETLKTIKR